MQVSRRACASSSCPPSPVVVSAIAARCSQRMQSALRPHLLSRMRDGSRAPRCRLRIFSQARRALTVGQHGCRVRRGAADGRVVCHERAGHPASADEYSRGRHLGAASARVLHPAGAAVAGSRRRRRLPRCVPGGPALPCARRAPDCCVWLGGDVGVLRWPPQSPVAAAHVDVAIMRGFCDVQGRRTSPTGCCPAASSLARTLVRWMMT